MASELLAAYAAVPKPLQRAILKHVQEIAKAQQAERDDEAG